MYCSDCIDYAPGGKCRNPKVSKSLVGYFQAPCREFIEKPKTTTTMETKPTTKVCKVCGQEKPLDHFQVSGFTKQPINTCKECMGARKKAKKDGIEKKKPIVTNPSLVQAKETPSPVLLEFYTDADLAAELRRRGYTGTLTKSNTLTI